MKQVIIMIGPPGSGKGTQAKKIAAKYGYAHISSGDLLRSLAKKIDLNSAEREAVENLKFGKMVPDELIYQLVFTEIEKNINVGKGVVLDGTMRNLNQAQEFQNFFKQKKLDTEVLVLEIDLSDKDCLDRITKRRVCVDCGEIIPWTFSTHKITNCPKCGGKLETRQDDDIKIVEERIKKQGNAALSPIINFYKALGILIKIKGDQSIEDVEKDITKALK